MSRPLEGLLDEFHSVSSSYTGVLSKAESDQKHRIFERGCFRFPFPIKPTMCSASVHSFYFFFSSFKNIDDGISDTPGLPSSKQKKRDLGLSLILSLGVHEQLDCAKINKGKWIKSVNSVCSYFAEDFCIWVHDRN